MKKLSAAEVAKMLTENFSIKDGLEILWRTKFPVKKLKTLKVKFLVIIKVNEYQYGESSIKECYSEEQVIKYIHKHNLDCFFSCKVYKVTDTQRVK